MVFSVVKKYVFQLLGPLIRVQASWHSLNRAMGKNKNGFKRWGEPIHPVAFFPLPVAMQTMTRKNPMKKKKKKNARPHVEHQLINFDYGSMIDAAPGADHWAKFKACNTQLCDFFPFAVFDRE